MYEELEDPQSPVTPMTPSFANAIFGQPVIYSESNVETQSKDVTSI